MRNPKLPADRSKDWYRYYAGYAPEFVEDALGLLEADADALVLDPWNGSGTTTAVAQALGTASVGYDANPALVLIARARLLGSEVADSVSPLVDDLIDHARLFEFGDDSDAEPLAAWFERDAVRQIRGLEYAIRHVLVEHEPHAMLAEREQFDRVSALGAFFYVVLFHAVRVNLRSFVASNPTWVKIPDPADRVMLDPGVVHDAFRAAAERLTRRLRAHGQTDGSTVARVEVASSTCLPLSDEAVSAVVTSPPYCTRIDYVAATRPELAVLGFGEEELRALRERMVGTPTIASTTPSVANEWGDTTTALLTNIANHESRASSTYYRKYYVQYFASLWSSLKEIRRVACDGSLIVVVVQDSYYKNVHVDLPRIICEMGENLALSLIDRLDFPIGKTKAAIHPGARLWRTSFTATESILRFT